MIIFELHPDRGRCGQQAKHLVLNVGVIFFLTLHLTFGDQILLSPPDECCHNEINLIWEDYDHALSSH